MCKTKYGRPSLIRIAWDQHLFRLVKVLDWHFKWRDNLFLFNEHQMGIRISEGPFIFTDSSKLCKVHKVGLKEF